LTLPGFDSALEVPVVGFKAMTIPIVSMLAGLCAGAVLMFLGLWWGRRRDVRWAHSEANEMVDGASKDFQAQEEELNLQLEEMREQAFEKFDRDTRPLVTRNEERDELISEREMKFKDSVNTREQLLNRKAQTINSRRQKLANFEGRVGALRERARTLQQQLQEEAKKKSSVSEDDIRAQIQGRMEQEARTQATRMAQEFEQEAQVNVERDAKKALNLVLNRFARPYCSERGIGNVNFENADHKARTFGPENSFVRKIEQVCGVDIVFNEIYNSATVMGFDPVRRELGRLVLDAASRQRNLNEKLIEDIYNRCKKDLFKKILMDGNRVANELRVPELHEDVRSMLGALRYRYSFAQNQHFHVAEVGWLAGLLSAELGLNVGDGRRAGLLHDIGKAMDHSREGGHAVIGADFIEKHGVKPEVVHAVRAHHYDEQPSSDLAFLTIAADAVSGARPGARRSTMDSYTQKMADLEKIGSSFEGVTATYILSAGREVRVIVDGHRVDDHKALSLSKQIAQKIEDELSFPGLIKVTVVRETQAVEFAR